MKANFDTNYKSIISYCVKFVAIAAILKFALISIYSTPAYADNDEPRLTAEELVEVCSMEGDPISLFCPAYIRGVLDGMEITERMEGMERRVCVGHDVSWEDLAIRVLRASIQFRIQELGNEVRLGFPSRDLSEVEAAGFVRWAFTSNLVLDEENDFRCGN